MRLLPISSTYSPPTPTAILKPLIILAGVTVLWLTTRVLRGLWGWRRQRSVEHIYLELTPPAQTDRTPKANEQLFSVLHSFAIKGSTNLKRSRKQSFSLEIFSTREQGIRYIMRVPKSEAAVFEQAIAAYLPEARVQRVDDPCPISADVTTAQVVEFRQTQHYAYPLRDSTSLIEHDPIAYITGAMTRLKPGEFMAYQLIVRPDRLKGVSKLRRKIINSENVVAELQFGRFAALNFPIRALNKALFLVTEIVAAIFHGPAKEGYGASRSVQQHKQQVAMDLKPARAMSVFETELTQSISSKLAQPLYKADIRVAISAHDKQESNNRVKSIQNALLAYSNPGYQGFRSKVAQRDWRKAYALYMFRHRLLSSQAESSSVFGAVELAALYHFPHSQSAKTENVIKSLSKTLPAPVSLKNGTKLDVLLGMNQHHGSSTPIGLTAQERQRHVYVVGGTGNGKTTMLLYGIIQDIKAGKGLAVIDPHGDLAQTILQHIPVERIDDVVYINPDDLEYPIGLNLLELPKGIAGDELLREKDLITESTISVLRKIFSEDDSGGHRIEYILRNTIQTALAVEGSTLFTIFELLNDAEFRRKVVSKLEDKNLRDFWNNELGKAGDYQRVKMTAGITAKIGRFLFSASAKRMLKQPVSTINFDDILATNKILICNFSKGLLGEDTSALFGTTILAKLQLAALRRARQEQTSRQPFYLYVDEFQNFATMNFVQMLSEARKYKLFLIMAEQSTSQQDQQRLVEIILANVGTVVCFRSGSPADERFLLPLFRPYIAEGEIANLPSFNFYARLSAVQPREPLSGSTVLPELTGGRAIAERVVKTSRNHYGVKTTKGDARLLRTQVPSDAKRDTDLLSAQISVIQDTQ